MTLAKFLVAGAIALLATGAAANPLVTSATSVDATAPALEQIHHKPGHQGGPPWARGRDDGRRSYTPERVTRRVCETRMQRVYDPYEDEYVRRETQVCRNV
jgi:hypothetical protein